jgi:hypothetical protein
MQLSYFPAWPLPAVTTIFRGPEDWGKSVEGKELRNRGLGQCVWQWRCEEGRWKATRRWGHPMSCMMGMTEWFFLIKLSYAEMDFISQQTSYSYLWRTHLSNPLGATAGSKDHAQLTSLQRRNPPFSVPVSGHSSFMKFATKIKMS